MNHVPRSFTAAVPYVLEEGEGEVIRWLGATVTVKASGPAFDVAVTTEVAGGEPPFHVHAETDEGLFVIDGALTVYAGDEILQARTGSFVLLPRELPHTFVVDSGCARLLTILVPSGAIGMYSDAERLFGDGPMAARPRPDDLARISSTLAAYGVTIVGPNPRDASARPSGTAPGGRE